MFSGSPCLAIKRDVQLLVAALLRNNLGQLVVHTLVPVVKKHFSTSVKKTGTLCVQLET